MESPRRKEELKTWPRNEVMWPSRCDSPGTRPSLPRRRSIGRSRLSTIQPEVGHLRRGGCKKRGFLWTCPTQHCGTLSLTVHGDSPHWYPSSLWGRKGGRSFPVNSGPPPPHLSFQHSDPTKGYFVAGTLPWQGKVVSMFQHSTRLPAHHCYSPGTLITT